MYTHCSHFGNRPDQVGGIHSEFHYGDVIMGEIASQITSLTIVYSTVYSDADERKHQSYASLARWIPRTSGQLRGKCFHLMTSSCCTWNPHLLLWHIETENFADDEIDFLGWKLSITYSNLIEMGSQRSSWLKRNIVPKKCLALNIRKTSFESRNFAVDFGITIDHYFRRCK